MSTTSALRFRPMAGLCWVASWMAITLMGCGGGCWPWDERCPAAPQTSSALPRRHQEAGQQRAAGTHVLARSYSRAGGC